MRIGVIQASSQATKNQIIYDAVLKYAPKKSEVINFGCTMEENEKYSYIEISILIGILLASRTVDFVVTGCSSGQGMMLACNSMPDVICGYAPTPNDAYLFAQINNGNAISLPLGENYTWSGTENLERTIEALFSEPFGQGYPKSEAERKVRDAEKLKETTGTITETFADIRTESYEKAVSGTALVEMVSVVVILAAIFSLINFIMISSKEDTRDIAKLRGMGISKSEIYKIYGTYAVLSVLWSVAAAVPASILFAKIGCTMVFDAAYYLRPFILTPELMFILAVAFFGVSYTAQIIAIKNMAGSKEYINVIRDMNR